MKGNEEVLIKVENLKKYFPTKDKYFKNEYIKAVDGISFTINKGETFGIVGESGCGKTTLGKSILRLYETTEGRIFFEGVDLSELKRENLLHFRKKAQMIFQNPYASLDGRMIIGDIIGEALDIHNLADKNERTEVIAELLNQVGLHTDDAFRYPNEFSGGQCQRIGIARALAVNPDFIVCDEPVSALDVSIQAQIINLLQNMQKKKHLTYLFIAHDLSVVQYISQKIGVMYLGRLVEIADSTELYSNPEHPYTQALISAVSLMENISVQKKIILFGDVPSSINLPSGCRFQSRCPYVMPICKQEEPQMRKIADNHFLACHIK